MLLVRAWVGPSKIHGLGLIAHEFIPKGAVVWKLVPGYDTVISEAELGNLPEAALEQIDHYAFFHPVIKKYVLCADDDRFCNHSDEANVRFHGDHAVAIRDIFVGEEITDNYNEFGKSYQSQTRSIANRT
jgi:SET domain-containing protein